MNKENTYICSVCGTNFKRYAALVSNAKTVCCSIRCRGLRLQTTMRGKSNPNYRHGNCIDNKVCRCGRRKDTRSAQCARCAGRGFPKQGVASPWDTPKVEVERAVKSSSTYVEVGRKLGLSRPMARKLISYYQLETTHFKSSWKANRVPNPSAVLIKGKTRNGRQVKTCILANKLLPYTCVQCGLGPVWNSKSLVLQLHHKDGDKTNNVLKNLEFVCPNCHSQTGTFTGRNNKGIRQSESVKHE